jgi:anti-sigma regulatory factor (Ser/Thr protein kinase)
MQSAEYFIAAIGYRPYSGARCLAEGMTMADGPLPSSRTDSSASSEIRIANRIAEMTRVAELVDSFGVHHDLPNDIVVALNVSLDEILNNIISYAYDDAGRHDIAVRLVLRPGYVEVVVEDDGKPFNPLLAPAPDLSGKSRLGGVGLHFVRKLTDHLEYARREGINELRFAKKLRGSPA